MIMQTSHYYIFSLPSELLHSLTPKHLVNRPPSRSPTPEQLAPVTKPGARACNVCQGVVFLNIDDQRSHFRSDWHRYNVKTRFRGGQTVSEAAFAQLLDELEDSLSGSASSDDEDDDSDAVNALVNKAKRLATRSSSPESAPTKIPMSPIIWFHSPPSTQLGIYRAILKHGRKQDSYLEELLHMQSHIPNGRKWAMFMVAGGHFAGAIVRVSRADDEAEQETSAGRKNKQKKPKLDNEILLHKTFHRYTTRRKQGGSQSMNDNSKGPAKSAGALLRRYGEQALRDDIRGLLLAWHEELAQCELIWVRASTSNRRIFHDYDSAPWAKDDSRLRSFPFPTRRPTQSELFRCLNELTRPKISHFTEEEMRAQDEAYLASLPKPKPPPSIVAREVVEKDKSAKQPTLSKVEETQRDMWIRLIEMVNKGRLDALKSFLYRDMVAIGGVNAMIPDWMGEKYATILQLAVVHGHEEVTRWLLEDTRADPTVPLPSQSVDDDGDPKGQNSDSGVVLLKHRTAYDLARSKTIRDIFRRAAAGHPDWWDWFGAGHVPSALTQEMEVDREEKKKVRRKGLKDRIRARSAKEDEKDEDLPTPEVAAEADVPFSNGISRLGGSSGAPDAIMGLTTEMAAKVERERRARAAEARLRMLGQR